MRAAFAGDLELVKLLLAHVRTRIHPRPRDHPGGCLRPRIYQRISPAEAARRTAGGVKLLVDLGEDVNHADSYGITPLMAAANLGDINIVRYLIGKARTLTRMISEKRTMEISVRVSSLMPIDYAIGVGTFVPEQRRDHASGRGEADERRNEATGD